MHALLGADRRQHPELHPRPRGRLLDARLPAHLHLPVRAHLPGRRRARPDARLGRRGRVARRRPSCTQASRRSTGVTLVDTTDRRRGQGQMQDGKVDGDHRGPGRLRRGARRGGRRAAARRRRSTVYTDPSRPQLGGSVYQAVGDASSASSTSAAGRRWSCPSPQTVQTENLNAISYFVPSMLGLSIMQVGIFAAIPLVADREKLILKRLAATPLRRWQLVGSNVLMRLLIALHPGGHHRRRRRRCSSGSRSSAACIVVAGVRDPRRDGVPRARLRHRLVRQDRGRGQRDDLDDPVPDDVPVGRVLPDRRRCRSSCRSSPGSSR